MKTQKISCLIVLLASLFFSCQKEYSLEATVTPAGTWQFNDASKLYAGNIDTAYIETTGTTKKLNLEGKSTDGQQNFFLSLYATDSFTVGQYKASLFEADFLYNTQAKTLYQAGQFIGEFIVNITAIGNNSVTGIFSGDSEDSVQAIKPITLGKFTARINLSGNGTGGGGTGPAVGTLGSASGVCTPASNTGTFTQGVTLTSAHTQIVQVNVTTLGSYTISTNTVNGVSFSSTGTFTTLGAQNVVLNGTGTPVSSGNQTFTVTFGSSSCSFIINFAAGQAPATGTLGGAPGACASFTPAGTYTQGIALVSANTVQVRVNVATIGSYTISTGTVNGVSFSASGTFTTTGLQNLTLTGTGTPVASGAQNFTVTFGSSTCTFSITFLPGTPPPTDYFPTTTGSFWNLGHVTDPTDSLYFTATSGTKTITGNTYNIFTYDVVPNSSNPDELYYRKTTGGMYYENFNFESLFGIASTPPDLEYKFLDVNVAANTSWQSSSVSVTEQGVTYNFYMKMTLLAKSVSATSGIVTSNDVMKVKYEYTLATAPAPPFVIFTEERWFAKGIGLIYNSFDNGNGAEIYKVGSWKVN